MMPVHCSVDEIVAAVVKSKCDGCSKSGTQLGVCVAGCINELPSSDVGPLFNKLCASLSTMVAENEGVSRAAKHTFRANLGVGYGALLLGSVFPAYSGQHSDGDATTSLMRAAVEESLQWHEEAVLSHVLVYFDDAENEELLHECGVVEITEGSHVCQKMQTFSRDLDDYVRIYGSSVRSKVHLRLVSVKTSPEEGVSLQTTPIEAPKRIVFHTDILHLPSDRAKEGEHSSYLDAVRRSFGESLQLQPDCDFVHYSAGGETAYDDRLGAIRATAHLYVVLQRPILIAQDYQLAMRDVLSRLAVRCALDRMKRSRDALEMAAEQRKQELDNFRNRVTILDDAIRRSEAAAEGVRAMLTKTVSATLKNWIPSLVKLQTPNLEQDVCGIRLRGEHNRWQSEHHAAALLKLVDATPNDEIKALATLEERWKYYLANVRHREEAWNPIWACLDRMGMTAPDYVSSPVLSVDDFKSGFTSRSKVFDGNRTTALFMYFAIGANGTKWGYEDYGRLLDFDDSFYYTKCSDGLKKLHDSFVARDRRTPKPQLRKIAIQLDKDWISFEFVENTDVKVELLQGTMQQLLESDIHPGYAEHDTSMALFDAFGIDHGNWTTERHCVRCTGNHVVRERDGRPIALVDVDQGFFRVRFKRASS